MVILTAAMAEGSEWNLTPPPESPFPSASGWVSETFSGPYYINVGWGNYLKRYYRTTSFQVWGLAANTWYYLSESGTFLSDGSGNASGAFSEGRYGGKPKRINSYCVSDPATGVVVLK